MRVGALSEEGNLHTEARTQGRRRVRAEIGCRVYKPRNDRVADNFIELRKRPGTDPALEPPEAANPADALVSDFWLPVQGE